MFLLGFVFSVIVTQSLCEAHSLALRDSAPCEMALSHPGNKVEPIIEVSQFCL